MKKSSFRSILQLKVDKMTGNENAVSLPDAKAAFQKPETVSQNFETPFLLFFALGIAEK